MTFENNVQLPIESQSIHEHVHNFRFKVEPAVTREFGEIDIGLLSSKIKYINFVYSSELGADQNISTVRLIPPNNFCDNFWVQWDLQHAIPIVVVDNNSLLIGIKQNDA